MAKDEVTGQRVITASFGEGAPGIDLDPQNPLARAARRRLETGGGLHEPLLCVMLRDPAGGPTRWLGVFTESEGGQLIFFPGCGAEHDAGFFEVRLKPDHISLSHDLAKSHVTARDGPHQLVFWSLRLGEGRALWFGMTIPTVESLRIVRAQTDAWGDMPRSLGASRARVDAFVNAINPIPAMIQMPGPPPFAKSLLHFCVAVLPEGAAMYDGNEIAIPDPSDETFIALLPGRGARARGIARLSSRYRLQLSAAWLRGEMRNHVVRFTVPGRDRAPDIA